MRAKRLELVALVALAFASAALAGCPSAEIGFGPAVDPLDVRWLSEPKIHGSDLAKLAEMGKGDAEVSALFAEATRTLGGSLDAVASHMTICPQEVTREGGLTLVERHSALIGRPIEEVAAGPASPTADAYFRSLKFAVRAVRRTDEPDSVRFDLTLMPKICFVQKLSVGEAYEGVVHELVHALRYDPDDVTAIAVSSPDEATFMRRAVLTRGGEAEAYAIATRARRRIRGGHFNSSLAPILNLDSPTPIAPEVFANAILAPPPRGLGYADGIFRGTYQEAIVKARETLVTERDLDAKLLGERRNFLAYLAKKDQVDQSNLGVFEHNAEVGKARGDGALIADSQRQYAETKASIARTKTLGEVANASIARLTARLADVEARLAALASR
jgi:hypothetical protein